MKERMSNERERMLIQASQASDERALEELVKAHMGLLRSAARRICEDKAWTEELVQAGCIGLIQAIQHYSQNYGNRLATYALPWILGEMRSAFRRVSSKNICVLSLYETFSVSEDKRSIEEVVGSEALNFEQLDLRIAIESLSEEEKKLLFLRFIRDYTQKETAEVLKLSQSRVSKLEKRIVDTLRNRLI